MTYGLTAEEARALGTAPRPRREPLLSRAVRGLRAAFAAAPCEPAEPDLIDHPAFRGMSLRELADLPFPRHPAAEAPAGAGTPAPELPRQ